MAGNLTVVSIQNFFVNGVQQSLTTNGDVNGLGGYGTAPQFNSITAGSLARA